MTKVKDTITLTRLLRIYPNKTTQKFINKNIHYRNDLMNKGIKQWEYDYRYCKKNRHVIAYKFIPYKTKNGWKTRCQKIYNMVLPNGRKVRNELTAKKTKFDRLFSNVILQEASTDLNLSYQAFFDKSRPDAKHPKIKHPAKLVNGSYADNEARFKDGKLLITVSRSEPKRKLIKPIRIAEKIEFDNDHKRHKVRIIKKDNKYYAAVAITKPVKHLMPTGQIDGVDVNVGHFNSAGKVLNILPGYLIRSYNKIAHYQRMLAKKRHVNGRINAKQSKNYGKIQAKLRKEYQRCQNIQHDIIFKYANYLVKNRDRITIEDLDVKSMLMSHIASKGIHRSLFGFFKQVMKYKTYEYGRVLVLAHKLFPSTQECPRCHTIKTGDEKITLQGNKKHGTRHDQFICNFCGYKANRDDSAYQSLAIYSHDANYAWSKEIRKMQKSHLQNDLMNA